MRATSDRSTLALPLLAALALLVGCDGHRDHHHDSDPPDSGDGGTLDRELEQGEAAPTLALELLSVSGATGTQGRYRTGDHVRVRFRVEDGDGGRVPLSELDFGRIHFAGPTFNYQRVLPEETDLLTRAKNEGGGVWSYTFAAGIPTQYAAPYNDTDDLVDAELTGQDLLSGTYTVGLSVGYRYTVEAEPHVALAEAARDVLFGDALDLDAREVTTAGHCNRCHGDLTAHEGERRQIVQCLMCHTAGAEDANDPDVLGGTPGVSIESRILFHKIHNARHLPSVIGIGVDAGGNQDYGVDPRPLVFVDGEGEVHDYSTVGHPVWPNRTIPRDKNLGYSGLSTEAKRREDLMRTGLAACYVCHGDPDGDGPLEVPPDGDLIFAQPARRTCGACHDDVDWAQPYTTNSQTMDPQPDDSQCVFCHDTFGGAISIDGGHLHPLRDPDFDPGLTAEIQTVAPSGTQDGDGSLDQGERLAVQFTLVDDLGADVDPAELDGLEVVVSGPTWNAQTLLRTRVPAALLTGSQPFTIDLPELRALEYLGDSTGASGESFATDARPHLAVAGAPTTVRVRTATAGGSTLSDPAVAGRNYLDVASGAGFARGDVVVVEDGVAGREEYLAVQLADADRLWFGSPDDLGGKSALEHDHPAGAVVARVTLTTLTEGADYTLNAATGTITEIGDFGAGAAVVVSYGTPWRMPATYPAPLHDSPDVGPAEGEWAGLAVVPGTYAVTLSAWHVESIFFAGETSLFPIRTVGPRAEIRALDAPLDEPYGLVDRPARCDECHQDLTYHDGVYRGFDACLACHGSSGTEDQPRYAAANAPETAGVVVSLRELLHRVHRGADLAFPEDFVVVGEGPGAYPDNYTTHTYGGVHFPAQPGGTLQCARCHGEDNAAWHAPERRDHPDGQDRETRVWRATCGACHDDSPARAHIDSHTSSAGEESCSICHAPGEEWEVERLHHPY